jgi:Holliday junction DNA helicase RuvA
VISYLSGTIKRKLEDRVVVDVGGIGYDVFLPQFVLRTFEGRDEGSPVQLDIYYHVTERQIRPTLIGFNNGFEKQFFEKFISVEDIGPLKAARALVMSVSTVARAIENEDVVTLRKLPGIGERTAKKMIATLRGKVTEEALLRDEGFTEAAATASRPEPLSDLREDATDVLIQLGHRRPEAVEKVDAALQRRPDVESVEDLIHEVYRGERGEFADNS